MTMSKGISPVLKFRKRPVEVEAMWLTEASMPYVAEWCGGKLDQFGYAWGLIIPTLEGDMHANEFDWIVRGVNGEFYPVRPDIFKKTYEAVT